jgi:hypothetical protein
MKTNLLLALFILTIGSLSAASSNPKDYVKKAAGELGKQKNYSWNTTVESPGNSQFRPGPTEGKTEKGGYTSLSMTFGDNTTEAVLKGTNGAIKTQDGWQSLAEASQDNGGGFNPGMFIARSLQNYKIPDAQAADLVNDVKDLKKSTNGISGDLTEDSAKALLSFRPRGGNGSENFPSPDISNAKGTVTFWIADGKLTKYQTHVTGHVSFNGNDRDVDRTTTTEIKDANSTKISVPDDAKKKL